MILFSLPSYRYLAAAFKRKKGVVFGRYRAERFANGTLLINLRNRVIGKSCVVIGGYVPDADLVETFLLAHTLKKDGAKRVILVIPFIPYARQDQNVPGESWAARFFGDIAVASGVDEIVTLDIHSSEAARLSIPVFSISPSGILATELVKDGFQGGACVAPDAGAIDNCFSFNRAIGHEKEGIIAFEKKRRRNKIAVSSSRTSFPAEVVVVDDILDTGSTLVSVCEKLHNGGAKRIVIVVSHGVFAGTMWKKLFHFGVKRIYCTDSNPAVRRLRHRSIKIIGAGKLLADYFG